MIRLTRLNGHPITLNSELIKFVEQSPDTVITLTNGEKLIVRESEEEVVQLILNARRLIMAGRPANLEDAQAHSGRPQNSQHTNSEGSRRG